jgi:hypothetical protein
MICKQAPVAIEHKQSQPAFRAPLPPPASVDFDRSPLSGFERSEIFDQSQNPPEGRVAL